MGMYQDKDGSFGDIKPLVDALEELPDHLPDMKALFVGTIAELQAIKAKKAVEDRLLVIEDQLAELAIKERGLICLPTKEEVYELSDGEPKNRHAKRRELALARKRYL